MTGGYVRQTRDIATARGFRLRPPLRGDMECDIHLPGHGEELVDAGGQSGDAAPRRGRPHTGQPAHRHDETAARPMQEQVKGEGDKHGRTINSIYIIINRQERYGDVQDIEIFRARPLGGEQDREQGGGDGLAQVLLGLGDGTGIQVQHLPVELIAHTNTHFSQGIVMIVLRLIQTCTHGMDTGEALQQCGIEYSPAILGILNTIHRNISS